MNISTAELEDKLLFAARSLANHPDPRVNRLADIVLSYVQRKQKEKPYEQQASNNERRI
jgi:hypothetical protein